MRKFMMLLSCCAVLVLAACGNNDDTQGAGDEQTPQIIEVEVVLPDSVEPGEEVKIKAIVTQGEEKVEDASGVTFEIWQQAQEADHEMLEAENNGDGSYSIAKTFEEEGFYYVVAHTTARDMHVMPRVELTVGNPDHAHHEDTEHEHNHDHESHKDDHQNHHGHNHEHESTLVMSLHTDALEVNHATNLSVEIKHNGKNLTDAAVRFEVWQEDYEKHEYIEATEAGAGVYQASTTFTEIGIHYVQVHVEKDDLHEHQLEEIEVK